MSSKCARTYFQTRNLGQRPITKINVKNVKRISPEGIFQTGRQFLVGMCGKLYQNKSQNYLTNFEFRRKCYVMEHKTGRIKNLYKIGLVRSVKNRYC